MYCFLTDRLVLHDAQQTRSFPSVSAFGKINHIVNNAGFTYDGMLHKINDKQWDIMLAVHNTAPFRILRAASPYLVRLSKCHAQRIDFPV